MTDQHKMTNTSKSANVGCKHKHNARAGGDEAKNVSANVTANKSSVNSINMASYEGKDENATASDADELDAKLLRLEELLRSYGSVALGYSGGVDSTFLAAVLARCMQGRALLVHMDTPLVGTPERESFERSAGQFGLPVTSLELDSLADHQIAANPQNRCYFCKRADFELIIREARRQGCEVVIDGSNADDRSDDRPGMHALRELGVRSPLREVGWHKDEERELLRSWGLEVWSMPAGACLATRIPCGEPITREKIDLVRACEDHLHGLGLAQVRARLVGGQVRVQAAPDDLALLARLAEDEGANDKNIEADSTAIDAAGGIADASSAPMGSAAMAAGNVGSASGDATTGAQSSGGTAGDVGGCDAADAIAPLGAVPLPRSTIAAFCSFGAKDVRPFATPYRYGSMSGQNPTTSST